MDYEQAAKHILREFVCLPRVQFENLLRGMADVNTQRAISSITDKGIAFYNSEVGRIGVTPHMQFDQKRDDAVRILSAFSDRIEPGMFFTSSNFPFIAFFLMEGRPYWISVLYPDEDYQLRMPTVIELGEDETLLVGVYNAATAEKIPPLKCRVVAVLLQSEHLEFMERKAV